MKKLILIVDDDPMITNTYKRILNKEGFEIKVITTGVSALSEAKKRIFDLILLDIGLPDINGIEVCSKFRQDIDNKYTPIIIITGYDDPQEVVIAMKSGADDYITKPIDKSILIEKINALLI
ncbi:MAG: response regulator transcription factor [Spirochaetes bacterium]|nr:response regulator transcription factor [Spirochaetota bacterium]